MLNACEADAADAQTGCNIVCTPGAPNCVLRAAPTFPEFTACASEPELPPACE